MNAKIYIYKHDEKAIYRQKIKSFFYKTKSLRMEAVSPEDKKMVVQLLEKTFKAKSDEERKVAEDTLINLVKQSSQTAKQLFMLMISIALGQENIRKSWKFWLIYVE